MDYILSIFDLYEKIIVLYPGKGNLVITIIMILITIGGYFKWIRNMHSRYRWSILLSILVIVIAFNLLFLSLFKNILWLRILICAFTAIVIIGLFYSIKHPLPISAIRLKKCKAVIENQKLLEIGKVKLFENRPWYMITQVERFRFACLSFQFFYRINDYKKAYLSLAEIKEKNLFDKERKKLYLMQMNCAAQLGALKKADAIYAKINKTERDTECFLIKSMIEEYKGDMVAASDYLQQALNAKSETTHASVQAKLFNNLGRMRMLENNSTDAAYYYQKCLELTSLKPMKDLRHVAYQNIIANLYGNDAEPNGKVKAEKYFNDYIKEFKNSTVLDLLELETFQLSFCRQFKTTNEVISIIEAGFRKLKEKANNESPEMLCNILASNFRLYIDNRMNFTEIMGDIRNNWAQFFQLKMPERYFFLKEIYMGMKMFNWDGFGREYRKEFDELVQYMATQAFEDITETLHKTSDFEICFRAMLMKERVACVKEYVKPYNFNHVYQLLKEVVDVYELNGLITEAVSVRLDIADECFAIYNMNNGIIKYADVMNEQVNVAIQQLETFKKHVAVAEMELRIAAYCLALGRQMEAKLYFERFKKQRVSPLHFKDWLRVYYAVLVQEFPEVSWEDL